MTNDPREAIRRVAELSFRSAEIDPWLARARAGRKSFPSKRTYDSRYRHIYDWRVAAGG
jgi:hypothetical protein